MSPRSDCSSFSEWRSAPSLGVEEGEDRRGERSVGSPSHPLELEPRGAGNGCGDGKAEEGGTWFAQGWPGELVSPRESPTHRNLEVRT